MQSWPGSEAGDGGPSLERHKLVRSKSNEAKVATLMCLLPSGCVKCPLGISIQAGPTPQSPRSSS